MDHAPTLMTASAQRGPNDTELKIEVSLGIPGILLQQYTASLRDAPDVTILAAPGTGTDSDLQKDLYIPGGETAFLRTSLRRHDIPFSGDVTFNVVGGGTISQTSATTDDLGIVGGIEFLPPAVPPAGVNATQGVSVVVVSYREDGEVHHDSIQISYPYTGLGHNGEPIGTTDYIRANQELERELANVTEIRSGTNFPDVDLDALGLLATEILRDWFMIDADDPAGEGSVEYWLRQVQSPTGGGAFPLLTQLAPNEPTLDNDYRNAFDAAIENWSRWFEIAKQLGLEPAEIVSRQQLEQVESLLINAYQHSIDRVESNCVLLAQRYREAPETTQQERDLKELYLVELLREGDGALRHYADLQSLATFLSDDSIADVDAIPGPEDLCYQVEIVADETQLIGTPENAQVRVKAGIRVDGVAELLLPPSAAPLVVRVRPLGNATVSGAIGRTDANGVFDAAHVSAGSGDETLVVDVDVVFDFGRTLAYTSKRLSLDSIVRFIPSVARESHGFGGMQIVETTETGQSEPIELVDGERAIVELRFTKGKTPLIGKRVNIVTLGGGSLYGVHPVTDASGRIRFAYRPPIGVGRARIAYAYQVDGETISNSIVIDYTTSRDGQTEIDVPFSEANLKATSEAGLYLAGLGLNAQLGGNEVVDENLLVDIQRTWLDSGVNQDGTINPDEPCGLRCLVIQAGEAPLGLHIKQATRAVFEYERWNSNNQTLGLVDALAAEEAAIFSQLTDLIENAIDQSVTFALENRSAVVAKDALALSTEAKFAGLIDDDSPYERVQLTEQLGYEIRVDEARLHGEADNAWLQVVSNIYLADINNPGQKVRVDGNTPLTVDLVPKGFQLATLKQTTQDGLYSSKVYMIAGDTDLELVVQVYDEFAASPIIEVDQPGAFSLDAGARLASNEGATLNSTLDLFAGQQAHVEGIVSKGLGRVGYRTVLVHVEGAPADSVLLTDARTNAYLFTPPTGQTGQAVIMLTLQAGDQLLQKSVTVNFSDQPAPEGEHLPGHSGSTAGNGLLNNEHTVAAFNEVNVPLAGESNEAALGNAFGLSSFQFPFSGGLPSASEFRADLGNWFSESFDLLHIADMGTLVGLLNGLPAQPEEIIRVKFDASKALLPLSPAALAADFSGLLPAGFAGSLRVDRPEIDGQVVFGLDTSSSPFYVLTKPDRLLTSQPSLSDFLNGGTEKAVRAGREATELTAKFGVAATFNSTEDLIDGVLQVPHAEGYLSSVVKVDFSEVAIDTGKLRFDNLAELANLKIGFDGSPIDTFQAIASANVSLPNLSGINDTNHPLANVNVVGAIHKKGEGGSFPETTPFPFNDVWEFQLRTADLFQLPVDIRDRLAIAKLETDDRYEPNDSSRQVLLGDKANLGLLVDRITIGGQDPANSDDVLALNDSADWFRFATTEVGNASSFVQVDFDSARGDLDLALYRLVDSELQHVRTDGLSFGDQARLTLLGLPAGIYFVEIFDDAGGLSPFYSLTIDPPGRRDPGIEVNIGDFHVVDTALEINVDSNLEFSGFLDGRMVMTFGEQDEIPVELGFRAEIDTVSDDPNENGGLHAEITTSLGGQSISTLGLTDGQGNSIVPPSHGIWSTQIDRDLGGYLIFDYQSASDFKFVGLDAANKRWVMGHNDPVDGWVVPDGNDWRKPLSPETDQTIELRLFYQGRDVEFWIGSEQASSQRILVQTFSDNIDGSLALGTPDGSAKFLSASLTSGTLSRSGNGAVGWPSYDRTVFYDSFSVAARPEWRLQKGVWRVEDDGSYTARSTSIQLGDWLLVDSANVVGSIDIQFNDNDILVAPPLNPTSEDEGSLSVGFNLSDVNALLFKVADDEDGTRLYEDQVNSPKGLVAINDGFLTIGLDGVRVGAGRVSAGIQDVLFVDISGAQINLTADPNEPLLVTSDIGIRVPALSDTDDFVTIAGQDTAQPIFGLTKPTLADPIPEFLLLQDGITIDFAVAQIQQKLDIGEVFPFTLESIGIRFNDAGNTAGQISNFADFDLLVTGQVNFENSIFGNLPFDPIFAVGQPILRTPTGDERQVRLSSPGAYSEVCTDPISATVFPDFGGLCQNGFLSAELHLGALLGDDPDLLLRNIGPFYVGFENLSLFGDSDPVGDPQDAINGALKLHGLIMMGGFVEGQFQPDIFGSLAVTGTGKDGDPNEETTLGSLTVSGSFVSPHLVNDQGTTETSDDQYQSSLVLDWIGQASGQLGDRFNVSATDASVRIHTEFINTFTKSDPFNLSVVIEPQEIDTGNLCVDLGPYVEICGSAVVRPEAGDDEPYIAVREGSLKFKDALGPLAGVSVAAGGIGLGRDGTIYVLPAGYEMGSAVFERGAHIELAADQPGGLFGLPGWLPVEVRKLGLQFNGLTDPNDVNQPLRIDNSIFSNPAGVAVPLTDPENFTLTISGGLSGNQVIPLTGDFENIRINLGSLAGCVAVATAGVTGVDLSQPRNYGYIFDSECAFPVEGLDGVVIGVEPIHFGPITVGGTLGLGVFTVERPVDPANPAAGVETRNVFYGIIEGELSAAGYGLGAEIIITQFGPVAGRLKAGVPIPIGTLIGALGGPVGAGLGTASGMILNDLEGGFVFGADPLPVVEDPRDIFTIPAFRTPLRTTVSEVQAKVADLAFENPSFSELVSAFSNVGTYQDILIGLFTGDLSSVDLPPMKFTWEDGFRAVISGTLSNQYAAGVLGLAVTAGVNVGFNFDNMIQLGATELPNPLPADWPRHPNGAPAMDYDGVALDPDGNRLNSDGEPIDQAVNQTLSNFNDLIGFQFFGFADIDILGTKMAGVGMLMDFSDPINPVFNLAAALPAEQGLLSLLLPFQGNIGLQVRTDGMLEGSILAALTFIDSFANQSQGFFHDVLTSIDTIPDGVRSPIGNLADRLEADRRFRANPPIPLSDRDDPNYDERYDPIKTGYDPGGRFYIEDLYLEMLDVDNSGDTSTAELDRTINRQFVIDRVLGNTPAGIESILPDVSQLEVAGTKLINLASIATKFIEEILVISPVLLQDQQQRQEIVDAMPFWGQIEEQMRSVHNGLTILVDDPEIRGQMEADFQASLDNALLSAYFSKSLIEIGINAVGGAAAKFVEVIDPSVRIVGQIGPAFLGIPIGRPSNQVDIYLDKNEFRLNGEFSVLSAIFNFIASPAWVNDRTLIDVYFPFENLLADAINFSFPTIDPGAGDWRIGLDSSFNVLGLEISKASGLMFPAGAETLLIGDGTETEPGKLQLYDPTSTDPIQMDKILVRQDHYDDNLLPNGGILMDGRLTLPRLVTDPFTLFAELDQDQEFKDLLAQTFERDLEPGEEPCDGVFNCLIEHPLEAMQLLGKVQEFIGIAASLEEVAQVQLFLPNVFNEGTTIQDAYLVGSYGQWPAPFHGEPVPYPTTSKILGIPLGSGRLNGGVTDNGIDVELVGNFLGLADVRFNFSTDDPGADTFTDANGNGVYDFAEPLTTDRAPFGIYNAPEVWTDLNGNGLVDPLEYEDLDHNGRFDLLGDGFVDLNLNGRWDDAEVFVDRNDNGEFDPPQMRTGAEFVLGTPPAGCSLPIPELQTAEEISSSMAAFLAQMGFTGTIDEGNQTVGDSFDWIGLSGANAGLCLRAFSPGFDPSSADNLKKYGGIEASAALKINDFFEGDFEFSVTPSPNYFLPDVNISAQASSILLPGLEGLSPVADDGSEDPLFGGALGLELSHSQGTFAGGLTGSIFLFGSSLELDADASLSFHNDGISGSVGLSADSSMSFGGLTLGGDFRLQFDTRPSTAFASIAVTNGFLHLGNSAFQPFAIDNASFEITVSAGSIRIANINADMALFGENNINFGGDIVATRTDGLVIDLDGSADLQGIQIGPGVISGTAAFDVFFDSDPDPGVTPPPIVFGTFDGDGSILGVTYNIITGSVSSDGCIAITDPLAVHFQLPGGTCGEANEAGVVLEVGVIDPVLEGDPATGDSDFQTIFLEVTARILSGDNPEFILNVPYEAIVTLSGAELDTDFRLPGTHTIEFTESTLTQQIPIEIRRDRNFEEDETFGIRLIESSIVVSSGSAAWFVEQGEAEITILNDDDPDFSELLPPLSTLVHFDFDQPRDFAGQRLAPALDEYSSQDLTGSAPLTSAFEPSRMQSSFWPSILTKPGLPTPIDETDGRTSVIGSNAANDSIAQAPSFFQFTVDPKSGGWLPQGLDFFAFGDDASGNPKGWELYWDRDGYASPILSSSLPGAAIHTETIAPDWDHHIVRLDSPISATDSPGFPVQGLVCTESPIHFRLQQTDNDNRPWRFDNLSLTGKYFPGGCLSSLDTSADEILGFLEQQDARMPGTFDLDDTGAGVDISFGQDPGTTDPTRYDFLSIELTGTSQSSTAFRLLDSGNVPITDLAPIHIATDGGLNVLDFDHSTTFNGMIEIGGAVQNGVNFGSLADGSSVTFDNQPGDPVSIIAAALGNDVRIGATGPLGNVDVQGGWQSGRLSGQSAATINIAGSLGADLSFDGGFGSLRISAGDLIGSVSTGLAGIGDVDTISVTSVAGTGGSILGDISIGGDLDLLSTSGGSITSNVEAGVIGSITSTLDVNTNLGGDIAGLIVASSIGQVSSTGGEVTASITTLDPIAPPTKILASPANGRGGRINSPNSFHFAGGIESIVANTINLRVESGGRIGKIIAVDDGPSRPASLNGRFTAHSFGRIETDSGGTANFELTATAEAWELGGSAAFETILVQPDSPWLADQIHLAPSVNAGDIEFHGLESVVEVSVQDATASAELGQLEFQISLSDLVPTEVSISVQTIDGTLSATAGDYTPVSTTVVFPANTLSQTVVVPFAAFEGTIGLQLGNPIAVIIADGLAEGTVVFPSGGDTDPIDNTIELGAPNQGDGNNDGLIDMRQNHVVSFVHPVSSDYVTAAITPGSIFTSASGNAVAAGEVPTGVLAPTGAIELTLQTTDMSSVIEVFFETPLEINSVVASLDSMTPVSDFSYNGHRGVQLIDQNNDGFVESMTVTLPPELASDFDGSLSTFMVRLIPIQQTIVAPRTFLIAGSDAFDHVRLVWDSAAGQAKAWLNDQLAASFTLNEYDLVEINTLGDSDWIIVQSSFPIPLKINAGDGDDVIYGGGKADHIIGGPGRDLIFAYGGDDIIDAGADSDLVYGGSGNDLILTGDGRNVSYGGNGDDTIIGGEGIDIIVGNAGNDVLDGGNGKSRIYGGDGDDFILGGDIKDILHGNAGDDQIRGFGGNDVVYGGDGNDRIFGGIGDDKLSGDDGDDFIDGQDGNDKLFGRLGNDTILGGAGDDYVKGGFGNEYIDGQDGNDRLLGDGDDDTVIGGPGVDRLAGNLGNDVVIRDQEDDTVEAELAITDLFVAMDVNADGRISPLDALLVINRIAREATGGAALIVVEDQPYDSNGDEEVTPRDALQIINYLSVIGSHSSEPLPLESELDRIVDEVAMSVVSDTDSFIQDTINDLAIRLLADDEDDRSAAPDLIAGLDRLLEV
ncbi:MAG: hypothetical protein KDB00_00335 [Planctomycetales bacterium]|nr:hypothetical protein [Planctomycetales bacterium]